MGGPMGHRLKADLKRWNLSVVWKDGIKGE